MRHALSRLVYHKTEVVENAAIRAVCDVIVPALHDLIREQATAVMKARQFEYDSPFALDVLSEIMIRELGNLITFSDNFDDEVIRPHQLTKEHARTWLMTSSEQAIE